MREVLLQLRLLLAKFQSFYERCLCYVTFNPLPKSLIKISMNNAYRKYLSSLLGQTTSQQISLN